jgi:hypothetical protein
MQDGAGLPAGGDAPPEQDSNGDDLRMVIAGGLGLILFLLVFALGQFVEIFRALGN